MSGSAAFTFDDVVVVRGGHTALKGITAEVSSQGITVVSGPSGAGKSTLLRLCNRLEVPASGRTDYLGRDIQSLDPLKLRRQVGMVFQRPTPFPGTVLDNLRTADPQATDSDLEAALAKAALDTSWLERDARGLSGGEAQRVCMARTLVTNPDVLLLDEPTSALDHAATEVLEGTVRDLTRQSITVLWVSHDPLQVNRIADHVLYIDDGRYAGDRLPEGDASER
jgi:putative ABC transport system ATP-binding protein